MHTVKYSNEHLETACCPPWRWCWDEVCVGWWPSLLASGPWARSNCAPSSSEPSDCRELPSCSPVKRRPNLSKTCQLFKIKHNSSYLFTLKLQIFSTLTTFRRVIVKIGDLIRFNFKWLILIRFHSNLPHLRVDLTLRHIIFPDFYLNSLIFNRISNLIETVAHFSKIRNKLAYEGLWCWM